MTTQHDFLLTCHPDLKPVTALKKHPFTPRRAIDPSGRLGSLYDACREQILHNDHWNLSYSTQSARPQQSTHCLVKTCTTYEGQNLLKWYSIHDGLRLSVALQMIPPLGVGALINYSRPIDKYTRFISYNYISRTDYLSDDDFNSRNKSRPLIPESLATHVIVLVNWGFIWVAILQLPPDDELVQDIDVAIQELCRVLTDDHSSSTFQKDEIFYLEKIIHTEVFSNTFGLSKTHSIIDFYRDIPRLKKNISFHRPYNYNLCPIQYFYRETNEKQGIYTGLTLEHISEIEDYLLQLSLDFRRLTTAMEQDYPNMQKYRRDEVYEARTRWSDLKKMYTHEIQRLRDLVVGARGGEIDHNTVQHVVNNIGKGELKKNINDFDRSLNILLEKENLIGDLLQKHFEYQNAIQFGIKESDSQQTLERKLLVDAKHTRIICSNDGLYKNNKSQWYTLYTELLKEHTDNHQIRLIYVDFSDCSYKLDHFILFPTIQTSNNASIPESPTAAPSEQRKCDDIINILLIGESGVGKSTFINAFVNYFQFDKLEQAQDKPIVLMPVSFVMTVGDDFQEHLITFGGQDNVSNEDYDHPGQSVTQHCKSYVFTLRRRGDRERRVRLIDTPGIGDIRGLAQDDINMQHILSFISNLTHLNAICILMRPNNARLNIFFRTCFMQLFDFLGESARENIIFCFTNTRATFYTPGDTAPLLKKLLESLPVKGIPFTKHNTFCFENASFRYLVAVQNNMPFSDDQKKKYRDSWNKSSTESKRFLEHICTTMSASLVLGESKSMKHVQLRISLMIRPMLETMRNILRNIILQKEGSNPVSIELCSSIIKHRTAICLKCPRHISQLGDFWITPDGLHVFYNRCRTCACSPEDHYPIDYELRYKLGGSSGKTSIDEMKKMLVDLCQTSAEFGHFLSKEVHTSENDPFLLGFNRMMKGEKYICVRKKPCKLNSNLLIDLKQLKKTYEDKRKEMLDNKEQISLPDMYDKISIASKYPMMKSQMDAVKHWENYMIKYYEYEVPI